MILLKAPLLIKEYIRIAFIKILFRYGINEHFI